MLEESLIKKLSRRIAEKLSDDIKNPPFLAAESYDTYVDYLTEIIKREFHAFLSENLSNKMRNVSTRDFIKNNYTLTNGGEDYMCNHSGQLVGVEDILDAYRTNLEVLHNVYINEHDMSAMIKIRDYFGDSNKPAIYGIAYDVLQRVVGGFNSHT